MNFMRSFFWSLVFCMMALVWIVLCDRSIAT